MMKSKLLCLFVLVCIMLPIFASCKDNTSVKNDGETDQSTSPVTSDTEVVTEEPFVPDFYLVENGTSAYVIVHAEDASPTEITATTELQSYIKQISGAELPIVSDAEAPAENEIIVGKTNRESDSQFDRESLGKEGFMIDINEGRIFLVGGEDVGTLYSAYTFLEEHLGCRFYTYNFERVPQNESIGLLVCEDTQIPVIATRSTSWYDINDGAVRDKRKLNFHRTIWATGSAHTLAGLAETGDGGSVGGDPCLNDENAYQTVLKNLLRHIEAHPNTDYVSVSQTDNRVFCRCTACAESISQYGYSGHYLKFVNRIANELAVLYPDIIIHTFAYNETTMPPKGGIVPADNVMVQLTSIECCHTHPLAEYQYSDDYLSYIPEGTTFTELIKAWSSISNQIAIWDYTTSYSMYNMINPNLYVLYDNIRLFAENKVHYTYMQGNRNST
ncbi:MAG: DUF4838 domain-containing protein, partial [Clostridia bacterium]|nr:DUF4838 domain-containing protein [Clostridia bacterium]